jgi:carbonic anhydrase
MKSFILIALLIALSLSENTNFDYSDHGDNWAPTWDNCDPNNEEMNQQSPIEITEDITHSNQSFLFSNFYSASATLSFLNTTVYLKSGSFGEIYSKTVGGDIIVMKATEMRFRSHSEHKVYGQFYDVEMQVRPI